MDTPANALAWAAQIVQVPELEMLDRLSELLGGWLPHRAVAQLSTPCASSPVQTSGEPALTEAVTGAELALLLASVSAGRPWQGMARIAGGSHPVLAAASDRAPQGSVLVFILAADFSPLRTSTMDAVQALLDLLTAHLHRLTLMAEPGVLAQSRAVATARSTAIAELREAHAAAFAGLLGVLRSRRVDDATARSTAIDLAVNALDELRTDVERDQALGGEEPAGRAFQRLASSLKPLLRHTPVELDLHPPSGDRLLASDVAHAGRVAVRALVLAMLEQDGIRRVHVGWKVADSLVALVRDDGPGELREEIGLIAKRVRAQGGEFEVDAMPGWGLTVKMTLPLVLPKNITATGPLSALGERELDVLERVALGLRNRTIAQDLHISESTVKFHVANILAKLEVGSRGAAAALFRSG